MGLASEWHGAGLAVARGRHHRDMRAHHGRGLGSPWHGLGLQACHGMELAPPGHGLTWLKGTKTFTTNAFHDQKARRIEDAHCTKFIAAHECVVGPHHTGLH